MSFLSADLNSACRTIFGDAGSASPAFLYGLHPSMLKAAYKKRAMETHPDVVGHGSGTDGTRQFVEVREAYELLRSYLSTRPVPPRYRCRPAAEYRKRCVTPSTGHYYRGGLPDRYVLFGQFLYFTGNISWELLMRAIQWQRRQRPPLGQLALQWGLLTEEDIICVLRTKKINEPFAECARRMRRITAMQQSALVRKQQQLQPLFGEFFVGRALFSPQHIVRLVHRQRTYNSTKPGTRTAGEAE